MAKLASEISTIFLVSCMVIGAALDLPTRWMTLAYAIAMLLLVAGVGIRAIWEDYRSHRDG